MNGGLIFSFLAYLEPKRSGATAFAVWPYLRLGSAFSDSKRVRPTPKIGGLKSWCSAKRTKSWTSNINVSSPWPLNSKLEKVRETEQNSSMDTSIVFTRRVVLHGITQPGSNTKYNFCLLHHFLDKSRGLYYYARFFWKSKHSRNKIFMAPLLF